MEVQKNGFVEMSKKNNFIILVSIFFLIFISFAFQKEYYVNTLDKISKRIYKHDKYVERKIKIYIEDSIYVKPFLMDKNWIVGD